MSAASSAACTDPMPLCGLRWEHCDSQIEQVQWFGPAPPKSAQGTIHDKATTVTCEFKCPYDGEVFRFVMGAYIREQDAAQNAQEWVRMAVHREHKRGGEDTSRKRPRDDGATTAAQHAAEIIERYRISLKQQIEARTRMEKLMLEVNQQFVTTAAAAQTFEQEAARIQEQLAEAQMRAQAAEDRATILQKQVDTVQASQEHALASLRSALANTAELEEKSSNDVALQLPPLLDLSSAFADLERKQRALAETARSAWHREKQQLQDELRESQAALKREQQARQQHDQCMSDVMGLIRKQQASLDEQLKSAAAIVAPRPPHPLPVAASNKSSVEARRPPPLLTGGASSPKASSMSVFKVTPSPARPAGGPGTVARSVPSSPAAAASSSPKLHMPISGTHARQYSCPPHHPPISSRPLGHASKARA